MGTTRNAFEKKVERQLKRQKAKYKYEAERIPYVIAGHYVPDFILFTKSGKIYLETKGYFRPEAKRKMVAVKKCNPQLDIRFIFYCKDLKYHPKSLKQSIKWAEKCGFKYALDTIPKEWFDE